MKRPKVRKQTFETAIIERYRRRDISIEEAIVQMYLAGVSVRRVEDAANLTARKRLYEAAKQAHPERWSGDTRNWTPVTEVWLNPPRERQRESSAEKKVA